MGDVGKTKKKKKLLGERGDLRNPSQYQQLFKDQMGISAITYQEQQKEQKANSTDRGWFQVFFDANNENRESKPNSSMFVFAKCQAKDWRVRAILSMFDVYRNEVHAYQTIKLPIPTPKIYSAHWTPSRFVIVMEDLSQSATGITFPTLWDTQVTMDMAKSVLSALAKIHATFWGRKAPKGIWTDASRPYMSFSVAMVMLQLVNYRCPNVIPPTIYKTFMKALWNWNTLRKYYSLSEPKCLVHGDSHIGNFYILPDNSIGTFDLQVFSFEHPMRDVSYFLTSSYPSSLLPSHELPLINFYLSQLASFGVSPPQLPSLDNCLFNYRIWTFYTLFAFVFSGGFANLQDASQTHVALERIVSSMLRLNVHQDLCTILSNPLV